MASASSWPILPSEGIRAAAERQPEKIALRQFEGGLVAKSVTYREFVARMNRFSNAAREVWGLSRGDHVAICAGNSIDFLAIVCGLGAVGIAVAKPNPKLSGSEINAICQDAGARMVFCDEASTEKLEQFDQCAPLLQIGEPLDKALADVSDADPSLTDLADEDSTFVLPYTSGTTGLPKGVQVTHRSRSLTFYGMGVEYGCYGPDDRFLGLAPMCHGAGFAFNLAPLYFGGALDLFTSFDPVATLAHIGSGEVTGIFLVPTHFQAFFAQNEAVLSTSKGHALKAIISNAAPLSQPLKEKIVAHFGEGLLHECYGSTEGGIVTSMRPDDQLRKVQCVGRPFVNTRIRLLDDQGEPVKQGEVGELFSSSPYVFTGYHNRPEETAKSLKNGWVSAGDLARQDEEGFYYIVGRKKEMIISGGINVYPREIETVLEKHPAIAESAVVGLPDDYWGERIAAAIVLAPSNPAPDEAALTEWCAPYIGKQKIPKCFAVVKELPRNPMGKVLKAEVSKFFDQAR
ncbi:class I adenylate-forming enzyme family protein [Altererythrobacter sp. GH1-8]|uniref:class I adenylate-forming enzyme family protein n=1 Tax=Altererythrobacter sp. GH1-8 TaxID=3349333 RepID=UPI00374CE72D